MKTLGKIYISSIFGVASTLDTKKEPMSEIELDANREAMRQNAGKMEVGTYEPIDNIKTAFEDFGKSLKAVSVKLGDLKDNSLESRRNGNQKWYNQFQKRRKSK